MQLMDSDRRQPRRIYAAVLLGATLVAGFLLFAGRDGGRRTDSTATNTDDSYAADSIAAVDAVSAFAIFATERRAGRDATRDHGYVADGLRRLAAALYIIPNREAAYAPRRYASATADLLEAANAIQEDSLATNHADMVRGALLSASAAIMDMQRARYPELAGAVTELGKAAKAIRADRPLLDQTEAIQRFFDCASDALRAMVEVGL